MAWRDEFRPASFRGIPFFIDGSQYTGGRRVTFHEFPDRDTPYPEDLGKVGKTFKVEGYLLGADYFETKRKMIEATDKFGPGELVHPYYGTMSVQCGAFSIDETKDEGGFAKISFQFYEAGNNQLPVANDNKKALLRDAAALARAAAKSDFDSLFDVAKLPGFAVDTARASVANAAALFERATKGVVTTIEGIANLAYGIRNLRAEINDLVQAPGKLSSRLADSLDLLSDAVTGARNQFRAMSQGFTFGTTDAAVRGTTPTRIREFNNKAAFDQFIQRISVAQAVVAAIDIPFESVEDASKVRNQLRDLIENITLEASNDEVFAAFKDLGAQMVGVLPGDTNLPNLERITLKDTTPSLVLAYDLFGDPDLEADIVTRNQIANPAFIVAGTELEVLDVS